MIYLFTAMHCEARAIIQHYHLKKETAQTRFPIFSNEDAGIRLAVTGVGSIAAAIVTGSVCTQYSVGYGDFLVNPGIAAGKAQTGTLFFCNQIQEAATGRTFYPDLLYRHPFPEAAVITCAKPVQETAHTENPVLYDMEAASIYQAGACFLGPHQMSFLKIVSDDGNPKEVTQEQTADLIALHIDDISGYLDRLQKAAHKTDQKEDFCAADETLLKKLYADMHCSCAMSDAIRQHVRFALLSGRDYTSVIRAMYQEQKLPCKSKREGKNRLEELKRRLL